MNNWDFPPFVVVVVVVVVARRVIESRIGWTKNLRSKLQWFTLVVEKQKKKFRKRFG